LRSTYIEGLEGAGSEELLYKSNEDKNVQDWSRDGRFLLYSVAVSGGRSLVDTANHDLWVLPLTPGNPKDRRAQPYLETDFNEVQGKFSPDSRFIAYRSDASVRLRSTWSRFPGLEPQVESFHNSRHVAPLERQRQGAVLYFPSCGGEHPSGL
jgi:hypothetical protein